MLEHHQCLNLETNKNIAKDGIPTLCTSLNWMGLFFIQNCSLKIIQEVVWIAMKVKKHFPKYICAKILDRKRVKWRLHITSFSPLVAFPDGLSRGINLGSGAWRPVQRNTWLPFVSQIWFSHCLYWLFCVVFKRQTKNEPVLCTTTTTIITTKTTTTKRQTTTTTMTKTTKTTTAKQQQQR